MIELAGDKLARPRRAQPGRAAGAPGREVASARTRPVALADEIGYPVLVKAAGGRRRPRHQARQRRAASSTALFGAGASPRPAPRSATSASVRRALRRRRAPRRGADRRRRRTARGPPRRARLLGAAPLPEGDRGGARADARRRRRAPRCTAAAVRLRPRDRLPQPRHGRVRRRRRRPASSSSSRCNCRIQVEHPVTEAVTGRDLVAAAAADRRRRAAGLRARTTSTVDGHAIECRLNAEDVAHGFRPRPGTAVERFADPGPRRACASTPTAPTGRVIPPYYDSLLAKLIAHGDDRDAAIGVLLEALGGARGRGRGDATARCWSSVLGHPDFPPAAVTTDWLEAALDEPHDRVRRHDDAGRQPEPVGRDRADHARRARRSRRRWTGSATTRSTSPRAPTWPSRCASTEEDPWERIRLVSAAMPDTPLGMITTGMRFISWVPADAEDVMRALVPAASSATASGAMQIADPSNDPARLRRARRDRPRRGHRGGGGRAHLLDQRRAHRTPTTPSGRRRWRDCARRWTACTSRTPAGC